MDAILLHSPIRLRMPYAVRHLAGWMASKGQALFKRPTPPSGQEQDPVQALTRDFQAALESVLDSGRGQLIDTRGLSHEDKARLLAICTDEAEQLGCAPLSLRLNSCRDAGTLHPLGQLVLQLLQIEDELQPGRTREVMIRARAYALGLPEPETEACLHLVTQRQHWSRYPLRPSQAAAVRALIEARSRDQALVLCLDDMQRADWAFISMLEMVVLPSMAMPVLWLLASDLEDAGYASLAPQAHVAPPRAVLAASMNWLAKGYHIGD